MCVCVCVCVCMKMYKYEKFTRSSEDDFINSLNYSSMLNILVFKCENIKPSPGCFTIQML